MTIKRITFAIASISLLGAVYCYSLYLNSLPAIGRKNVLYLPSEQTIRLTSGTFRPFAAQLLLIKGVQDIAEDIPDRMSYFLTLFGTCLQLDPKLSSAYFLGGVVVPGKKEDIPRGVEFLKKYGRLNQNDWQIPFWIGFHYLQLGDMSGVIEYYKKAAALPGSPAYLKTNLAYFYYRSDKANEGALYLQTLAQTVKNQKIYDLLEKKILWLKQVALLEEKIGEFRDTFGRYPYALGELVQRGLIDVIPPDPFGKGYYLDVQPSGDRVHVKSKF